jgi:hypothetical protein
VAQLYPRALGSVTLPWKLAEVEVTLRLTVSQSVSMSWHRVPLWNLRPDIISCRNVAVRFAVLYLGGALSDERTDLQFAVLITQWSESLRTCHHILLSHLRLPQPGGPGSRIYIPQEQGGPVIPPGTG